MMDEDKKSDLIMRIVLDENKHTTWLANMLAEQQDGTVTLVDPKYKGMERKGEVSYTNMALARHAFDIPDKLYLYAYMDPENRK